MGFQDHLRRRFNFIGWGKFKFTDRWFLFGLFCLAVSVVLMVFG
jgi:hypothetical protein